MQVVYGATQMFHGTYVDEETGKPPVSVGQSMVGRGEEYKNDWIGMGDIYKRLEELRPSICIPHYEGVFMCDNIDDIDICGGATDAIMVVKPEGEMFKHDLSFITLAQFLASDGAPPEEIDACLRKYWEGEENEGVYEYITRKVTILSIHNLEEDERVLNKIQRGLTNPCPVEVDDPSYTPNTHSNPERKQGQTFLSP